MRKDIHPTYYPEARVVCSCGNTWTTGSTQEDIRTDVCSNCHPFFTGEQRIVDTAGQVDRFMKRLNRYSAHQADASHRQEEAIKKTEQRFLNQQLAAIELDDGVAQALLDANIVTVGDLSNKMETDQESLLALEGVDEKTIEEAKGKVARAKEAYFAAAV